MKSYITGALLSSSVLTALISIAAAQEAQPPRKVIVVGAGNDLRCTLDKALRITKTGEPITAILAEPVYVGTIDASRCVGMNW